jgi:hypothetical protein
MFEMLLYNVINIIEFNQLGKIFFFFFFLNYYCYHETLLLSVEAIL